MDMTGSETIPAPQEKVYEALNDPKVLEQAIPGCQWIEKVSDTEMNAAVKTKVGPVSATFNGGVTLSDLDPPNGYTLTGQGKGGAAGFAKGSAKVTLEPDGDSTVLHYSVHADVGGKLAQLGGRLINSTAQKLAGQFFRNLSEIIGEGQAAPSAETEKALAPEPKAAPEPAAAAPAGATAPGPSAGAATAGPAPSHPTQASTGDDRRMKIWLAGAAVAIAALAAIWALG